MKGMDMENEREKYQDCLILMQSILSSAHFTVETPNEAALVKAMEVAGFPVTIDVNTLDTEYQYKNHKTFITELIDSNDLVMRKLDTLKRLMLLVDPAVSNIQVSDTQVKQWGEFIAQFPDEAKLENTVALEGH